MTSLRPLLFLGQSKKDLLSFPPSVQGDAGYQLQLVQQGQEPEDWKPMKTIGPGVNEIRIREMSGAYRVIYVAKLEDAVYVLHCFQKKSQRTDGPDLEIATKRYKELIATKTRR
jgi:phage-related protein